METRGWERGNAETASKSVRGPGRRFGLRYTASMQFNPNALLVTAVFVGLLWFTLERGFGFVAIAALVAIALEAALGWGLWTFFPEWPRRRR